jgi:hypothetical protein
MSKTLLQYPKKKTYILHQLYLAAHEACDIHTIYCMSGRIVGQVGRATAHDAMCCGLDPCRKLPGGVAVEFCPDPSGWFINQLGDPSFVYYSTTIHTCRAAAAWRASTASRPPLHAHAMRHDLQHVRILQH